MGHHTRFTIYFPLKSVTFGAFPAFAILTDFILTAKTRSMENKTRTNPAGEILLPDEGAMSEKPARPRSPNLLKCDEVVDDRLHRESIRLEVHNNMPAPGPAPLAAILMRGEHTDIRIDVQELLTNADEWVATPNSKFAGRCPLDLIGTPDEQLLRDTLRSVIYSGMA
jgi:hypothetical protein